MSKLEVVLEDYYHHRINHQLFGSPMFSPLIYSLKHRKEPILLILLDVVLKSIISNPSPRVPSRAGFSVLPGRRGFYLGSNIPWRKPFFPPSGKKSWLSWALEDWVWAPIISTVTFSVDKSAEDLNH